MAQIQFPPNPSEDDVHDTGDGRIWVYKNSAWRLYSSVNGADPIDLKLAVYDLSVAPLTGPGDLTSHQVFTLDNTTAGLKTVNLTDMPANRAMTVVIVVKGNAGGLNMPVGTVFATGVTSALSTSETIFVLFWDGKAFTVTANIRKP